MAIEKLKTNYKAKNNTWTNPQIETIKGARNSD